MAMALIWTAMVVGSIICGLMTGNGPAVAAAALDGAAAASRIVPDDGGGSLPVDGGNGDYEAYRTVRGAVQAASPCPPAPLPRVFIGPGGDGQHLG